MCIHLICSSIGEGYWWHALCVRFPTYNDSWPISLFYYLCRKSPFTFRTCLFLMYVFVFYSLKIGLSLNNNVLMSSAGAAASGGAGWVPWLPGLPWWPPALYCWWVWRATRGGHSSHLACVRWPRLWRAGWPPVPHWLQLWLWQTPATTRPPPWPWWRHRIFLQRWEYSTVILNLDVIVGLIEQSIIPREPVGINIKKTTSKMGMRNVQYVCFKGTYMLNAIPLTNNPVLNLTWITIYHTLMVVYILVMPWMYW